jgi:alcohol dehydrogenase
MKAMVYHRAGTAGMPGRAAWEQVADPGIEDSQDVVVRVETTTVSGTDLHILSGDLPEVAPGTVLGHEAVGEVVEAGRDVRTVRPGDRVLVSCITACGRCRYCREAVYGQCRGGGGWLLGHRIDGTQAEYVRVPFADHSLHPLPGGLPGRDAVLCSDVYPTGYELGARNGQVGPGDTVVVVGTGPVGLATIAAAGLFSPHRIIAVDLDRARLEAAELCGADARVLASDKPDQLVDDLTEGLGADVAVEAVGSPDTFELCTRMVRPGGRIANIGVHGRPAVLHLEDLWIRDVTIRTGLVDTSSAPMLLGMLATGRLPASPLVTHVFGMGAMEEAYEIFAGTAETGAVKVALQDGQVYRGDHASLVTTTA